MLDLLYSNPLAFVIWGLALIIAVDIHEFAHALAADKMGDPTPRLNGRLTLNPLAHLDPLGTLALLIAHVGWGKPVPIDPFNLRNPRRDSALISLAGPVSNFILAGFLSLIMRFSPIFNFNPPVGGSIFNLIITPIIVLSIGLGVFNLIPIPPLDGSKVLLGFIPRELAVEWEQTLNQYGIFFLLLLFIPFFGQQPLVSTIISPIINLILNFLL